MKSRPYNALNLVRILEETFRTIFCNITGSTATIVGRYQLISSEAIPIIPVRKQQTEFDVIDTEDYAVIMWPKRSRAILRGDEIFYTFLRFAFLS